MMMNRYEEFQDLEDLTDTLEDGDQAVREKIVQELDGIIATRPEALAWLIERATDEERPPLIELARYLVHVGTPETIEAALPTIAGDARREEQKELLEMLAGAEGLTNERLTAILDEGPGEERYLHRAAAEILGMWGIAEGYRKLFREHCSRWLLDEFIDRGSAGIRILCCAFPERDGVGDEGDDQVEAEIAARLAGRRKKTEAVVREIIADPSSGGARTAIEVLGYWDEPHHVETLMNAAQDPRRDPCVRDEAILSLCRIEAPEAIDLLVATLLDRERAYRIRWSCADALGRIGKPEPLEALASVAKDDPDEWLRRYATSAIEDIQYPEAA